MLQDCCSGPVKDRTSTHLKYGGRTLTANHNEVKRERKEEWAKIPDTHISYIRINWEGVKTMLAFFQTDTQRGK